MGAETRDVFRIRGKDIKGGLPKREGQLEMLETRHLGRQGGQNASRQGRRVGWKGLRRTHTRSERGGGSDGGTE